MYPFFVCALGDFLVLFVPVLRQIARYLPHHRTKNDSKTHSKSSHDKFKAASYYVSLSCPYTPCPLRNAYLSHDRQQGNIDKIKRKLRNSLPVAQFAFFLFKV